MAASKVLVNQVVINKDTEMLEAQYLDRIHDNSVRHESALLDFDFAPQESAAELNTYML